MTTPNTIKRAQLSLLPEHIGFLKSCSSLIALYRRIECYSAMEKVTCKLWGYLKCLTHCGLITAIERDFLFSYYHSKDRSKEE